MNHKESPQDLIKPIIKLFFSGQVEEALDAVEVLIKNYPNEPLLFNICGVFYKEIGQLNEAVKRFNKALTINQEEETQKLLQYCELDWDENCLSFHQNKRAVQTASSIQVRKKMYQGSSEAWKKHEEYLQPLIKALSSY